MGVEFLQAVQQLLKRETCGAGSRDDFARDLIQVPLPLGLATLHLLMADKCAGTLLGVDDTANLEFPISSHNRIRVDRKIDGELAHGRQLIACAKRARRDPARDLVDDLPVNGYPAVQVQMELKRFVSGCSESHCRPVY